MNWFSRFFSSSPAAKETVSAMPIPADRLASLRESDIFLLSYPRSGNTWVRRLLFELLVAENPGQTKPGEIDFLVPDLHKSAPGHPEQDLFGVRNRVLKSHNIEVLKGRRFVYIFRDPADSLLSYYHYLTFFEKVRRPGPGDPDVSCRHMLDSWVDHVTTALEEHRQDDSRVLFISYEMLHADTEDALRRIATFCGWAHHPETITAAVKKNAFENLQKVEGGDEQGRFFRRGIRGSSNDELKPETVALIRSKAGELYDRAALATGAQLKN